LKLTTKFQEGERKVDSFVLFKSKEIEKWGSGLKRIYEECLEHGVKIELEILKTVFVAVFYRQEKEGTDWKTRGLFLKKPPPGPL
jgi:predicted HTH transcriptional regulator